MGNNQFARIVKSYSDLSSDRCLKSRVVTLSNTPVRIGNVNVTKVNIYGYNIYNPNSVDIFLKLYDSTNAPIVGVDSPVLIIQVAAMGSSVLNGTDIIMWMDSGSWQVAVTGYLDTDNTAPVTTVTSQIIYQTVIQ